jgi:hypothetical protein
VIVLDKLLVNGVWWVLRRVTDAVNHEMNDVSSLREALLAEEMRLELGEISEAEFRDVEEDLLARMRELRAQHVPEEEAGSPTRYSVETIEANVGEMPPGRHAGHQPRKRGRRVPR